MIKPVYLDYNAGAPLRPEARAALLSGLEYTGNPSSVHAFGRDVRGHIENARRMIAEFLGVFPEQVFFTSGATEANNWLLRGMPGDTAFFVSAIEHDSVLKAVPQATILPVHAEGQVRCDVLAEKLATKAGSNPLISVMLANNETGIIQPLEDVIAVGRRYGAWIHCDATQAIGKIPLSFEALRVHSLSFSGHKLGAAPGVGVLVLTSGCLSLQPLHKGGGQERGMRAGTENMPAICSMAAALNAAASDPCAQWDKWRSYIEQEILQIAPDAFIVGQKGPRVTNTTSIAMPRVTADMQLMQFDLKGIAVSSGAACSSGKVRPSHVLTAMGCTADQINNTIRLSMGWGTQEADIRSFLKEWQEIYFNCLAFR